jgi:hypothetical protein
VNIGPICHTDPMNWKQEIRRRLANLALEPTREAEIVEELAQHLEDRYQELLSSGASAEEASREALAQLPKNELLTRRLRRVERQVTREPVVWGAANMTGRNIIDDLWQDLRYGIRMLRRNPGFSLIAIATLALGIGANTAIFSVINGVLLRPLAFNDPDRLFMLWTDNPTLELGFHELPPANTDPHHRKCANQSYACAECFLPAVECLLRMLCPGAPRREDRSDGLIAMRMNTCQWVLSLS